MGGGVAGETGAREADDREPAPGVHVFDKGQNDVALFDGLDPEAGQREILDGFITVFQRVSGKDFTGFPADEKGQHGGGVGSRFLPGLKRQLRIAQVAESREMEEVRSAFREQPDLGLEGLEDGILPVLASELGGQPEGQAGWADGAGDKNGPSGVGVGGIGGFPGDADAGTGHVCGLFLKAEIFLGKGIGSEGIAPDDICSRLDVLPVHVGDDGWVRQIYAFGIGIFHASGKEHGIHRPVQHPYFLTE